MNKKFDSKYLAKEWEHMADQLQVFLEIASRYVSKDLKLPIEEVLFAYKKTKSRLATGELNV